MSSHGGHDLVDDSSQVVVIFEAHIGGFQLAETFDIDLLVRVDQDVRNRGVLEQRFQRTETQHFMEDFGIKFLAFKGIERQRVGILLKNFVHDLVHFGFQEKRIHAIHFAQIHHIEQAVVDPAF